MTAAKVITPYGYCLSIRQPWAWLIANGYKDIENRSWPTRFRGRVLIHAAKGMSKREYEECRFFTLRTLGYDFQFPRYGELLRGGIVGECEIVGCESESDSPWFFGPYGFLVKGAKGLPFYPCKGQLGFFKID